MLKIAFSTVGCPSWTLEQVADAAEDWDFDGVELRTFGPGGTVVACDPCLTDPAKVARIFDREGVEVCGLASSMRYDEPLSPPPPIGFVFGDPERPVRETKPIVAHARAIGAGYVRVFPFEVSSGSRKTATRRICERLRLVCDDARHQGVFIALENGGSYATAAEVMEIVDRVNSPLLRVCYSLHAAAVAGESPADGVNVLGSRLLCARIKDLKDGKPCVLGEGDLPCEAFTGALERSDFDGFLVYEWDRLWLPDLAPLKEVAAGAAATLTRWAVAASSDSGRKPAMA